MLQTTSKTTVTTAPKTLGVHLPEFMVHQPKFLNVASKSLAQNPGYYSKFLTVYFLLDTKKKAHIGPDQCLDLPTAMQEAGKAFKPTGFIWWDDAVILASICAVHGNNQPDTLDDLYTSYAEAKGFNPYRKGAISCAVALLQHHQGQREKFAKWDEGIAWQGKEGKKRKKKTVKVPA